MGEVYLAEDARLQRRVALKGLPAHRAVDGVASKRLLREARSAATLDHPNICPADASRA
jgi:serine/threonine protein kinase